MSLYDRSLCDNRWKNVYFQSKSTSFRNFGREVSAENGVLPANKKRKRNSHEKFSTALTTCKKLANVLSLCSDSDFERKLAQLENLNALWMEKKEVGLQLLEASTTSSSGGSTSCEPVDGTNEIEMEEEDGYGDPCPEVSAWTTMKVDKTF